MDSSLSLPEPVPDPEDAEHDGWCTPPMMVELNEEACYSETRENDWEPKSAPSSVSGIMERSIDRSRTSSSCRDPKDVYNLIPGEELSKCKENRRPSNGITPPPPSPMHVVSSTPQSGGFRVPLKEKSSSVEGKGPASTKSGRTSDGSGSASPEPSDTSLVHIGACPSRGTPGSGLFSGSPVSPSVLTASNSSSDLKKTRSKKGDFENGTPASAISENSAFKRSDSRLSTGASAGSSIDKKSSRKSAWYNRFNASYKTKSESFRKLFNLPSDERLLVDYSCALQRDILLQGRMYISQNYVCFYANIFRWETIVSVRCKDIRSVKRERTARVIPNAIQIATETEKYFFTSFATREKTYTMVFRVWQNALMDQPMSSQELWDLVHRAYGDELGLTSDDDDYVAPGTIDGVPALAAPSSDGRNSDAEQTEPRRLLDQSKDSVDLADEDPESPEKTEDGKLRMVIGSGDSEDVKGEWSSASGLHWSPDSTTLDGQSQPKSRKKLVRQRISEFSDESDSTKSDIESAVMIEPKCTESHADRVLIDIKLPVSVDQAFTFLFTASEFYLDFLASKKTHDIVLGEWEPGAVKGEKLRSASFKVPVVTPMGPRISVVTQKQRMISCSKPGHLYSINVEVVNGDIPYADSFYVDLHFCLSKINATESRLLVTAQIKFRKSVWGFIRGFIEKNTWIGLNEYYDELKRAVLDACADSRPGLSRGRGSTKSRLRLAKKAPGVPEGVLSVDESASFLRKGSVVTGIGPGMADRSLEVSPDAEASTLVARTSDSSDDSGAPSPTFLTVILIVLVSLLLSNVFLFSRLWALEQSLHVSDRPGASLSGLPFRDYSNLPEKPEALMRYIREQEKSHLEEVAQWQEVISSAADLLKQVEGSLGTLRERLSGHPLKVTAYVSERLRNFGDDTEVIVENDYED